MRTLLLLVPGALLTGCPFGAVNPNAPQPIRVPPGCETDLSGTYLDSEQPAFRYDATDDGGTLQLVVERAPEDAGVQRARKWDPVIHLERTPQGFVGDTRAFAFDPGRCPVRFPTELSACADGGLTLRAAAALNVDPETCTVDPTPPVMRSYRLVVTRAAVDAGGR